MLTIVLIRHLAVEVHGLPVVVLYSGHLFGGTLLLFGATLYPNKLLLYTDWMLDAWYVTRLPHRWQRGLANIRAVLFQYLNAPTL